MNLGHIIFDPGHVNGANVDPRFPKYSEGTAMFNLGVMLEKPLTRKANERPELHERATIARRLGADTLISLHSNYPAKGVIVYYSVKRPDDRAIAELLGSGLAEALGIGFNGAEAFTGDNGEDYFGIIRYAVRAGIPHVFLVEHGAHEELAQDTQAKLQKIADVYNRMFFNKEEETGMTIIIPFGTPDMGPALTLARYVKGAVLDWSCVALQDDVIQIGGPSNAQPKAPCKSFKVISGPTGKDTALAVFNSIK